MDGAMIGYPEEALAKSEYSPRQRPVEEILQMRLVQKQKEVADIEAALKVLKDQPQLLETLNLLRKVGI